MLFSIVNNLIYLNSIYNTYKTGNDLYKKYKMPIRILYNYSKRKYYKY